MNSLWFLSAPPLGPGLFRSTIERLKQGNSSSILSSESPNHGLKERAVALAQEMTPSKTVIAHGLAVPAAIQAAILSPPGHLILTNGPVTRLDPVSGGIARMARSPGGKLLVAQLFRPSLWISYLASSAGLRRAVINPYVMDRDTVASLARPEVASAAHRQALASYLASLPGNLPDPRALTCTVSVIWGDADPLYPAAEADYLTSAIRGQPYTPIPGGQHLHPEERPWELAEAIERCIQSHALGQAS